MPSLRIYVESLGCPRNQVDSEVFCGIACNNGAILVDNVSEADIVVVNTCGFIKEAKEESLETILEVAEAKKRGAKLIVTGCLVKRYQPALEKSLPEVDAFIGLKDYDSFAALLKAAPERKQRKLLTKSSYAYLKISDGCENYCSYCSIPSIRGKVSSEPFTTLLTEASLLAEKGIKELIVTAMDISQYGAELNSGDNLLRLIEKLVHIQGIEWIRLLYLHPANVDRELLRFIRYQEKICPYLDIPVQHINDTILKSMNRRTKRRDIENLISLIRTELPEAALRTSLITGYPGETEEQHQELLKFVRSTKFNRLGVFSYSREENTPAYDLPDRVHPQTALRRKRELMKLQEKISSNLLAEKIGKKLEIIIDGFDDNNEYPFEGRTRYDAPEIDGIVLLKAPSEKTCFNIGDIVKAEITNSLEHDLIGEICEE